MEETFLPTEDHFGLNDYNAAKEDHEKSDPMDNYLPVSPYISKIARLNSECSDPLLLENCVPGQKWKWVNERGRWRKHKCKFHLQPQHRQIVRQRILTIFLHPMVPVAVAVA